tara:strand:- start:1786 stop:2988 length:1203 start_codon:yes stop_codon:yes gene_type:complete
MLNAEDVLKILELPDNEYIYNTINNIKIYNGERESIKNKYLKLINLENQKSNNELIFTNLIHSTSTISGYVDNFEFKEEEIINKISIPTNNIIEIGCNYGILTNPNYTPPKQKLKSNKGRKKKDKKKVYRKRAGINGLKKIYFASQLTFEILSYNNKNKIYKIKLFRNGKIQVPGVNNNDLSDIIQPIKDLINYLNFNIKEKNILNDGPVSCKYLFCRMRNYICRLKNENNRIDLDSLENILYLEKNKNILSNYDGCGISVSNNNIESIKSYFKLLEEKYNWFNKISNLYNNYNPLNIFEIKKDTEKCSALLLKLNKPNKFRFDKKITIKILKSGKINFDGGNSQSEVEYLYYWLNNLFIKNYNKICVLIINNVIIYNDENDSSSSEESNSSIYDFMLNN